jgi:1-acyl-sn-glycerol-3-phosphate acyltransferase
MTTPRNRSLHPRFRGDPGKASELPASARWHPARFLLYPLRPLARTLIRLRVKVRVHNGEKLPKKGPVILASNHVGIADGPLLAIFAPRAVHALTKQEMFKGFMKGFLLGAGQIPLDRFNADPLAVKRCLRVLRSGRVIGIFPEGSRGAGEFDRFHTGAAYLAMVTGAPIVPVVQFGTREPGAGSHSLPAKGVVVDMVFGDAFTIPATPWPRRKQDVAKASLELREHLIAHLEGAKALTGRTLPGPLPANDADDPDPATGVTDQEAM